MSARLFRKKLTLGEAIQRYRGEMKRRGYTANSQNRYGRELQRFAEFVGDTTIVGDINQDMCREFMDRFDNHEPSTVALENTILSGFFAWLVDDDVIPVSPMAKVKRPKVPPLADRVVTRISQDDVLKMLAACESWPERMCLFTLAFTGARRHAASELRWRDIDLDSRTLTLREKGRKAITKPIADQLWQVYQAYLAEHQPLPTDFVIPNRRPTGNAERSDRIVYNLVKQVAARCGVATHVHALRAAFAVAYLEMNPGQAEALQQLMGHSNVATTFGYLREFNRGKAMETVRSLSFGTPTIGGENV